MSVILSIRTTNILTDVKSLAGKLLFILITKKIFSFIFAINRSIGNRYKKKKTEIKNSKYVKTVNTYGHIMHNQGPRRMSLDTDFVHHTPVTLAHTIGRLYSGTQ